MLLLLAACGAPDPYADTVCSHSWPVDIVGAEWRYEPDADSEFGPDAHRTVRAVGSGDWNDQPAWLVETTAELDYETVDSYRLEIVQAWACDDEGTWLLGRDQQAIATDEDGSDTSSLRIELAEPVLYVGADLSQEWSHEVDATAIANGNTLEGTWTETVRVSGGVLERTEQFSGQEPENTSEHWTDGVGLTRDEGRWQLVE